MFKRSNTARDSVECEVPRARVYKSCRSRNCSAECRKSRIGAGAEPNNPVNCVELDAAIYNASSCCGSTDRSVRSGLEKACPRITETAPTRN
jgi:hypothetical protein